MGCGKASGPVMFDMISGGVLEDFSSLIGSEVEHIEGAKVCRGDAFSLSADTGVLGVVPPSPASRADSVLIGNNCCVFGVADPANTSPGASTVD